MLFLVFGAICVAGAVNLLVQRHPINSALSLVVVMGSLAVEYLLLGAEFVAAVQVIVYAGAIMVLFVFVIMLLNAGEEERTQRQPCSVDYRRTRHARWGCHDLLGAACDTRNAGSASIGQLPGHPQTSHNCCSIEFLLPFEVTSILVLIAIMGAVVLAAPPESVQESKREG